MKIRNKFSKLCCRKLNRCLTNRFLNAGMVSRSAFSSDFLLVKTVWTFCRLLCMSCVACNVAEVSAQSLLWNLYVHAFLYGAFEGHCRRKGLFYSQIKNRSLFWFLLDSYNKKNLLRDEKRLLQTYHGNKATIIIRLIREKLLSDQTHCIINCYETNGVNQIHQRKMCEHLNISCTICTSQILLDVGQTIARINQSASRRYREVSWWISNHPIVCSMWARF